MANIFVLNYLINRQLEKKGGKLIALFVDLKAAFDTVNRKTVVEAMKKRGKRRACGKDRRGTERNKK